MNESERLEEIRDTGSRAITIIRKIVKQVSNMHDEEISLLTYTTLSKLETELRHWTGV